MRGESTLRHFQKRLVARATFSDNRFVAEIDCLRVEFAVLLAFQRCMTAEGKANNVKVARNSILRCLSQRYGHSGARTLSAHVHIGHRRQTYVRH